MRNFSGRGGRAAAVVLGGGVVGLAAARELARRGLGVTLVERGRLGSESSWAAAGMLAPQVEANRRDPFFDFASQSLDAYPAFAAALLEETGLDIELDCAGTLYPAFTDEDERECEHRFAWQRAAGLPVERLSAAEARTHEPALSPRVRGALRFPRAWQVENRKLCEALRRACLTLGVEIREQTEARAVRVEQARVTGVETSGGVMPADAVVIACGAWSSLLPIRDAADGSESSNREGGRSAAGGVRAPGGAAAVPRIEPVRGQIVCFAPTDEPLLRHVVYSPRGYLVPRRDGRLLAGTTTERVGFDKSVTDAGRRLILSYAEEIAPALARLAPAEHWAGLRPHAAADDLPVIGEDAEIERLFFATGHYRNGILLAPLTGALVAEAVASGVPHPALAPFSPARPTRAAAGAV